MKKTTSHYKDETLISKFSHNEKGQIHGMMIQIFENGKKYSQASYKNDVCHGIYQSWWDDGKRYWIDTNKNRTLNGIEIIFNY